MPPAVWKKYVVGTAGVVTIASFFVTKFNLVFGSVDFIVEFIFSRSL